MKINDVKVGEEYAFEAQWRSERRRVRAVAIEGVKESHWSDRTVRKVKIEVLDWETGEPKPDDARHGRHVMARSLEPFELVRLRLEAAELRRAGEEATVRRVKSALVGAGLDDPRVSTSRLGQVEITLSKLNVEHLLCLLGEVADA